MKVEDRYRQRNDWRGTSEMSETRERAHPSNRPFLFLCLSFPFLYCFFSFFLLCFFSLLSLSSPILICWLIMHDLRIGKRDDREEKRRSFRSGSSIIPPSSLYHISSRQSVFMRQLRIGCERMEKERTNLSHPSLPSSVRVLRSNRQRGEGTGKRDGTGKGISLFIPSSFPFHWWLLSPLTLTKLATNEGKGKFTIQKMLFSSRSHISPFHVMSLTNSLASTTERTGT